MQFVPSFGGFVNRSPSVNVIERGTSIPTNHRQTQLRRNAIREAIRHVSVSLMRTARNEAYEISQLFQRLAGISRASQTFRSQSFRSE